MGHRQLFFAPQTSNVDSADIWNCPYPDPQLHPYVDPHLHPGVAIFLVSYLPDASLYSMYETIRKLLMAVTDPFFFTTGTAAIGVHPVPYFDITLRSNNFPSANFSLDIPNHNRRANPGALHDPFLHPASASSSNQMPANYIHGGPSCYDGCATNSHMDCERSPFKRKNPSMPVAFDRGDGNCYHIAGSFSSLNISFVNSQVNPMSGPQYWACDPNSMPPSYGNNSLLTVGEGTQRNVRSRQTLALHPGNNQNGAHPPSSIPHHLHPTSNISGLTAAGQWGHTPPFGYHRRILPPGQLDCI